MRLAPTLALTAATTATALPNLAPRATPTAPATKPTLSHSNGFYLTARLSDPAHDLNPSIDGWTLGTAHTGAGLNAAVLYAASSGAGRLFYENGTQAQAVAGQTTLVTDGGTPLAPSSLIVQPAGQPPRIIDIDYNQGTPAAVEAAGNGLGPQLVNGLGQGTFLACNATVPYYGYKFVTLQYLYGEPGDKGQGAVPADCVPISLVPQCTTLNDLPPGSYSSHEFAVEVACYA
ncbi:68929eb6-f8fe-43de-856b-6b33db7b7f01 [Thermothielavioides terrestris]|jgi:hypothetical protein|uniref:DUF7907 domain-containing protein n=2 Tax=Thermothielavioides terrestris TaxID=2587410 RepID=G2QZK0_THETT|nr:uncharacterized protein THITE_2112613 [Thermothielavioides terrestris NRRL 8126]AEO65526.1 hypothetical protein THITE_2112613 [Thermothielavioides terrestris NRRL 8126]SPQ19222.1 68929eb6-f8fe-43de-856b-6b33db7b7f01 [Thermothielavioides terrestris]